MALAPKIRLGERMIRDGRLTDDAIKCLSAAFGPILVRVPGIGVRVPALGVFMPMGDLGRPGVK